MASPLAAGESRLYARHRHSRLSRRLWNPLGHRTQFILIGPNDERRTPRGVA